MDGSVMLISFFSGILFCLDIVQSEIQHLSLKRILMQRGDLRLCVIRMI